MLEEKGKGNQEMFQMRQRRTHHQRLKRKAVDEKQKIQEDLNNKNNKKETKK